MSITKSIDETTELRVSSKRYTTEDLLCFFVCNMRPHVINSQSDRTSLYCGQPQESLGSLH